MCQPLNRVPPGGGIELQKHTYYMRDLSVAMTKNEDIWFYDSNDFTVVYSPNAFIYITKLKKIGFSC